MDGGGGVVEKKEERGRVGDGEKTRARKTSINCINGGAEEKTRRLRRGGEGARRRAGRTMNDEDEGEEVEAPTSRSRGHSRLSQQQVASFGREPRGGDRRRPGQH
eukprot:3154888-Pyramimonas_sp.AAC.2